MYSNGLRRGLIKYLLRKIDFFRRQGLRFSHKIKMNMTFISSLDLKTYEHYNNQPMQMVERILKKSFIKNQSL